jgi:uncharacterized protein YbaR (Trm112 family)
VNLSLDLRVRGAAAKVREESESGGIMPVSKELLDILVCPECKTPVTPTPDQQGLKCATCRRVYPVRNDIPIMIVADASIDSN